MKLSPGGLKNMNWKQFLVDHGEKLVMGLVVLMGLGALATSRWAPYKAKSPYGLEKAVTEARDAHKVSVWPEAEQQEHATSDNIRQKADELLSPLDSSKFAFGRTLPAMYWPVIPQKQLLEEPKWFSIDQLVAESGTLLYPRTLTEEEMLASMEEMGVEQGAEAEEEEEPVRAGPRGINVSDFTARNPRTGTGLPGAGIEGYPEMAETPSAVGGNRGGGGRGGAARGGRGAGGARGAGSTPEMAAGMPGLGTDGYSGMMGGMMGGMGMGPVEAEAKRYVSVRGVFPIKNQERELARALGAQSTAEVANALWFQDFELERQTAVQGTNPWSGPWSKVDIQIARDVLSEQSEFSLDVVDPNVTNSVFTMPLPGRLTGDWTEKNASHPALTQFALTEEAKIQQQWLQTKIAEYGEYLEEQNRLMPTQGGFGAMTYDTRSVGSMMMGDSSYMTEMMGSPMGGMGGMGMSQPGNRGGANQADQLKKLTKEEIQSMLTASGTYLLFRYLDFDVKPGNAYRYRVRLKVRNPSYQRDPGEAADRHVVEGEFRFTDWSQPTPPTIVPEDTRHFLVEIDQPTPNASDRAVFELFQWSEEFGTFVNQFLTVEPGQFIGGTAKAQVIDPAAQTFEEQDFKFTSNDILVDIERNGDAVASRTDLGISDRRFRIPAQVLTVNDWGGLQVQDPVSVSRARGQWASFMKATAEGFQYMKDQAAATGGAAGMGMEEMYGDAMMAGGGRGGASPLKRGRGKGRGEDPGMSGESMMEGMGGAGGRPRTRPR